MYVREPIPRINGKYEYRLEGIDEYAKEVAKELVNMYPKVDIIDIQYQFEANLKHHFSMELLWSSVK